MQSKLKVSYRGTVHELPVCYTDQQLEDVRGRWDGGIIVLERIYEMESDRTLGERAIIVVKTLRFAGVHLPGNPTSAKDIRAAFLKLHPPARRPEPPAPPTPPTQPTE